ncbi:hypothetical protein Peur_022265 [Populus x canadensis]
MGMTQGDGTYLEGDLVLEGTGEDWKLDVEWYMSPLFMYFVIVQPARRSWRPFIPSQHRHEFYHRREFFPFEKFAQPCSHRRMMELGYGVWGHSLAYKESKEPENFQGAS